MPITQARMEQETPMFSYRPIREGCPYKHGEFVCDSGMLWALTYSECAPPDQRQAWKDCPYCTTERKRADHTG